LILVSLFSVLSSAVSLPSRTIVSRPEGDSGFEAVQEQLVSRIDRALEKLDKAEGVIENNPRLSQEAKDALLQSLQNVENGLESYKTETESAESVAEIVELNKEVVQYLVDNKDVIKNNVKNLAVVLGLEAVNQAEEYIQKAEQILKVLKVVCPSEADNIKQAESQLNQLEQELNSLEQAIDSGQTLEIKKGIIEVSKTTKELTKTLQTIQENCLPTA
jgi:tetratricopeptide (TPR) repeat protein